MEVAEMTKVELREALQSARRTVYEKQMERDQSRKHTRDLTDVLTKMIRTQRAVRVAKAHALLATEEAHEEYGAD